MDPEHSARRGHDNVFLVINVSHKAVRTSKKKLLDPRESDYGETLDQTVLGFRCFIKHIVLINKVRIIKTDGLIQIIYNCSN